MTQHEEYTLACREAAQVKATTKAARDARILELAAKGHTPVEIAQMVGVHPTTVTRVAPACTRRRDTCLPLGLPAV